MLVALVAFCLLAADGEKPPERPAGRFCVVVPKSPESGGPFVAELLAEADTHIEVRPAGASDPQKLPRETVGGILFDRPPALKQYLEAYGVFARCRWIFTKGALKPQLGCELTAKDDAVTLRLLDTRQGWKETSVAAGDFRTGSELTVAELERIVGPMPPLGSAIATTNGVPDKAACERCGGKKTVACRECTMGKIPIACARCKGTGSVTCERCSGIGRTACKNCGGTGLTRGYTLSGTTVDRPCGACRGKRELPCVSCSGHGKDDCPDCRGSGKKKAPCPACHGKRRLPCSECAQPEPPPPPPAKAGSEDAEVRRAPVSYPEVEVLALAQANAAVKAELDNRVEEAKESIARFGDLLPRYRECMQGRPFSEFRTYLRVLRPEAQREIAALYREVFGLKDGLERLCAGAAKKAVLVDEQLAALSGDQRAERLAIEAADRRLLAVGSDVAKFEEKPSALRRKCDRLSQAIEAEVAGFTAKQAEKEYRGRLCEAMRETLAERFPGGPARVTFEGDAVRIVISIRGRDGKLPSEALLAQIGDAVFADFDVVQTIEVRTLSAPLGTLDRTDWEEDYAARQAAEDEGADAEVVLAAAEDAGDVENRPARAAAASKGGGSSMTWTVLLLLGGIAGSFFLLILVVRSRPDDRALAK